MAHRKPRVQDDTLKTQEKESYLSFSYKNKRILMICYRRLTFFDFDALSSIFDFL